MKTFLGITTGLLVGFVAGVAASAYTFTTDKNAREYFEKNSKEFED